MNKRVNGGRPENRADPRRNFGVSGTIVLNDGQRVPCTVSDLSHMGAMLVLESAQVLPNDFTLEIGAGAASRRCYKMRQDGAKAGVRFPERQPGKTM